MTGTQTRILMAAHALLLAGPLVAQEMPKTQPPVWSAQPDIAAFEKIEHDRLAAAQREVDRIVQIKGEHTVENTLAPFDEAMRVLNTANYFSMLVQQLHPDEKFRDRATAMTTKVSGAQTSLSLNRDRYLALSSVDVSKEDPATRYYVQRQLLEFRLAGVDKDDSTRARSFGAANSIAFQNAMSEIAYQIYSKAPSQVDLDLAAPAAFGRYTPFLPTAEQHMYATFIHLGVYSSAFLHLQLGQGDRRGFLPAI